MHSTSLALVNSRLQVFSEKTRKRDEYLINNCIWWKVNVLDMSLFGGICGHMENTVPAGAIPENADAVLEDPVRAKRSRLKGLVVEPDVVVSHIQRSDLWLVVIRWTREMQFWWMLHRRIRLGPSEIGSKISVTERGRF
ncbi:uncharacterized protein LOC116843287 [Odontomachus brunneus]|uniref:uncharacterized protein LOC116843287 n=1 Tax=Odontomachus brunneus TaxID=486640 RepID=UPI0013F19923|nr:uncharacterized protein LOC116843287 [Odontomachus brunneus]